MLVYLRARSELYKPRKRYKQTFLNIKNGETNNTVYIKKIFFKKLNIKNFLYY